MEKKELEGKTYVRLSQEEKAQLKTFLNQLQSGNLSEETLKQLQAGTANGAIAALSRVLEI